MAEPRPWSYKSRESGEQDAGVEILRAKNALRMSPSGLFVLFVRFIGVSISGLAVLTKSSRSFQDFSGWAKLFSKSWRQGLLLSWR